MERKLVDRQIASDTSRGREAERELVDRHTASDREKRQIKSQRGGKKTG